MLKLIIIVNQIWHQRKKIHIACVLRRMHNYMDHKAALSILGYLTKNQTL